MYCWVILFSVHFHFFFKSLNRGIQNQDRLKFLKLESLALLGSAVRVIVLESLYVLLF